MRSEGAAQNNNKAPPSFILRNAHNNKIIKKGDWGEQGDGRQRGRGEHGRSEELAEQITVDQQHGQKSGGSPGILRALDVNLL